MRIAGLSSGMDVEKMISDLVAAQRVPVDKVFQQKVLAEWKRDAYRDVNTKLLRFRTLAFDMTLQGTYQKNVATSSMSNVASVSATGRAQEGSYELKVSQLAEAARFTSSEFDAKKAALFAGDEENPAPESISFKLNGQEFKVTSVDTLDDIAAKINSNKDVGVVAFAHEGQISFTTKDSGTEAKFEVDENFTKLFGGDVAGFNEEGVAFLQKDGADISGKDAEVTINGINAKYSSNTFDLNGITVTLHEVSDKVVKIDSRHDVDAVIDKIKEFVNIYNELVEEFNGSIREGTPAQKGRYEKYMPLTEQQREALSEKEIEQWEAKAKTGLLRSDPILGSVLSEMRMALGGVVDGLEGSKSLSEIGITTGAWFEYGKLYINEEDLRSALEEDPQSVRDIFTNPGSGDGDKDKGIARRLTAVLDKSMNRITDTAGKASISYDQSFLGERIREYEDRLSIMEERLIRFEENQWKKFTAMEKVLGQLYAQGDWLTQQLMSMQG